MSAYLARGRRVGARSRYARAWPEHPGRPSGRLLWTLGSGAEGDALRGRQSNVEDRGEAAVDHAPAVEKAVVGVQARVVHDLRPGGVAGFLGRPFDPGLDAGLAVRSEERRGGKAVSVRVDLGARRLITNQKTNTLQQLPKI